MTAPVSPADGDPDNGRMLRIVGIGPRGFPNVPGGIETYCTHLYPILAARGHDVIALTRNSQGDGTPSNYRGVRIIPVKVPFSGSLECLLYSMRATILAARLRADVVQYHAIAPSVCLPLARLFGLKTVLRHVGADYRRVQWGPFSRLALRIAEVAGCCFATAITCVAPHIAAEVRDRRHRPDAIFVPNGVPDYQPVKRTELVRELGLEPGRYAISAGRFVRDKGFHTMIRALRGEAARRGWKLVIVGGNRTRHNYVREVESLAEGAADVVLAGRRHSDDLRQLISHAGLYVCSSTHEGMSFAVLEAMAHGLRCLVTDIPANRAFGLEEECYFRAGDPASLRDCFARHVGSGAPAQDAAAMIRRVRERHDWHVVADRMEEVFRDAANGTSARPNTGEPG